MKKTWEEKIAGTNPVTAWMWWLLLPGVGIHMFLYHKKVRGLLWIPFTLAFLAATGWLAVAGYVSFTEAIARIESTPVKFEFSWEWFFTPMLGQALWIWVGCWLATGVLWGVDAFSLSRYARYTNVYAEQMALVERDTQ